MYRKIFIDDENAAHRELSIYRKGHVNAIRLNDEGYFVYQSLPISAHNYAALFHYNSIDALNALPFISETKNGLDSWDEAYLPNTLLEKLIGILGDELDAHRETKPEEIMLGWQDSPEKISYWRVISPTEFCSFLESLMAFVKEAQTTGYDLEFIL
ncbi:conserved hypothetical protein [Chloroherpeton thalassium ATCC 35110]|uniref:Uncharacterized protein n=2 Tax=Chloroherpeton thalassium TaxID=100716 RepID=B3QTM3_CHLT3|nr:conserved hypothetical protein [Chloroherpeton thalassium ATCC 35110]